MKSPRALYRAMLSRDPRYDGKFYVGVKTTGIYCRPICPARPKPENVEFFRSAISAERAGHRPCLRCRPEAAPDSPAWIGKSAIVNRALRTLASDSGALGDEDEFARRFGVSARHLRRLFEAEIGTSPKRIADLHRLGFARKLVVESSLPMAEIADASGFGSLRRFNDAFRKRFGRPPSALRRPAARKPGPSDPRDGIEISLAYRPPYAWEPIHRFFARHPVGALESTADGKFTRVFRIGTATGAFVVDPESRSTSSRSLRLRIHSDDPKVLFEVSRRVRKMFDLDSDPLRIESHFGDFPLLDRLVRTRPGLRLPRGFDGFETGVSTILGQLVSSKRASALLSTLIENYGEEIPHPLDPGTKVRLFPTPERLSDAGLDELGTTGLRKETIRSFSRSVASGKIHFSEAQDPESFKRRLRSIPGIGPWSAECLSLRTIGDPDAFPSTDLILRRATGLHPEIDWESVKPWRSYAAIHLWEEFAESLSNPKRKETER